MKAKNNKIALVVMGMIFYLMAFSPQSAYSQIPDMINYQGYLTDSTGTAITDNSLDMVFSLFSAPSEGSLLWTEAKTVNVVEGLYTVILGESTPIGLSFDGPYYLEVQVGGEVLSPRQPLTSVAYAFRSSNADDADLLDGLDSSGFSQTTHEHDAAYVNEGQVDSISTAMIQDDAIGSAEIANGGVDNEDLANNAVTAAKISPNTVTANEINTNIVSSIDGVSNDGGDINLIAGTNMTITPNDSNNTITFDSAGGAGGITNITAGSGLTGGGSTPSVTLNVGAGTGITVNANDVALNTSYGDGRYVNEGQSNSITSGMVAFNYAGSSSEGGPASDLNCTDCVSSSEVDFTIGQISYVWAGAGLTGGGGSGPVYLDVAAGTGISVAGDTVSVAVPLSLSNNSSSAPLQVTNSGSGDGIVISDAGDDGINISGANYGLWAPSCGYYGVRGGGNSYGVYGTGNDSTSTGVYGSSSASGTSGAGVRGDSSGSSGRGVWGQSSGSSGIGVYGYGHHGIYGYSTDSIDSGYAGFFQGNVWASGNILKGGYVSFLIDHPLDPENKYMRHTAIESSELKNLYDGVVELDDNGEAWVDLPGWFEVLNTDFRYQLTPIGAPGPNLYIAQEISDDRFKIAGGTPGMKISWQVSGNRQDPYALAHPMVVEMEKPPEERGYYINPHVYGQPEEKSLGASILADN